MEVCGFNGTSKSEQNNEIVNLTVDLIERGGEKNSQRKCDMLLKQTSIRVAVKKKVAKVAKEAHKSLHNRAHFWLNMKLCGLGRHKSNQMYRAQQDLHKMRFLDAEDSDTCVQSEKYAVIGHLSSSKEDVAVKKYLDQKVPYIPKVETCFEKVGPKLEHAFVSLRNLMTSILTLVCTNPAFEEHVVWFLDEEGGAKEFFIEFMFV